MRPDPLSVLVRGATPSPSRVIAILHGHGDDPAELFDRVVALVPDDVTVIAPVGPVRTADGTPAWFVAAPGDVAEQNGAEGTLAEALHRLADTFDPRAVAGGTPPTVVLGYSQGAATALALAFGDAPEPRWRPAAVAVAAGWLASDPDVSWDFAGAAPHTRARLLHGEDDEVVDAQMGRGAARVLERAGVEVDFFDEPGGHPLTDDGIVRLLAQFGPEYTD